MGVPLKKYFLTVLSSSPPQLIVDQDIPEVGKVIEIKSEQMPNRVDAAWLEERFPISRKCLIDTLRPFNKGSNNKHCYDPTEVVPILENLNLFSEKRQGRRKN